MKFLLDNNVDAAVATAIRLAGHDAWTAADAGLNDATDDTLTVYAANREAVLITHDREFSQRRRRNVSGHHMWLRCDEWEAADLLLEHLAELIPILESQQDLFIVISKAGYEISRDWS